MSQTPDLTLLRDRILALTWADREVDALIEVATFVRKHDEWGEFAKMPHAEDRCEAGTYWLVSRSGMSLRSASKYTASTDAILSLIERELPGAYQITLTLDPSGCGARIVHWPDGLSGSAPERTYTEGVAVTLALAACLALINAKIEEAK